MEYTSIRIAKPDRDALKEVADREGLSIAATLHRLIEEAQLAALRDEAERLARIAEGTGDAAQWRADVEARAGGWV